MFILIPEKGLWNGTTVPLFTFHYVYINTVGTVISSSTTGKFTFHYVYINTHESASGKP